MLVNVGADYLYYNSPVVAYYIVNVGYSITPKFGVFVENYGNLRNKQIENRWDAGLTYLVGNDIQFDIYGGAGKNLEVFDYFMSIGVSWRFRTFRSKR